MESLQVARWWPTVLRGSFTLLIELNGGCRLEITPPKGAKHLEEEQADGCTVHKIHVQGDSFIHLDTRNLDPSMGAEDNPALAA